ncbi:MAG: hypothetical protein WC781_02040 [Candidatus Pacearchaeota archaeon]|jgi:hypothetical protein
MVKDIERLTEIGECKVLGELDDTVRQIFDDVNSLQDYLTNYREVKPRSSPNNLIDHIGDYLRQRETVISLGLELSVDSYNSRVETALGALRRILEGFELKGK